MLCCMEIIKTIITAPPGMCVSYCLLLLVKSIVSPALVGRRQGTLLYPAATVASK